MTTIQFFKGETVLFLIEIKNTIDNVLTNPTSTHITIVKNKSAAFAEIKKVDYQNMSKQSDGKYGYKWLSDEVGSYTAVYATDNNGDITMQKDNFTVIQ